MAPLRDMANIPTDAVRLGAAAAPICSAARKVASTTSRSTSCTSNTTATSLSPGSTRRAGWPAVAPDSMRSAKTVAPEATTINPAAHSVVLRARRERCDVRGSVDGMTARGYGLLRRR